MRGAHGRLYFVMKKFEGLRTGSWDPPSLINSGYPGLYPVFKAAGAWSSPLNSI